MIRYVILGLLLLPSFAFGLDVILQVDGQTIRTIDADRVNVITDDRRQLIDVRTEPKSPDPVEPPKPSPTTCNPRPPGVGISALNWRHPGSQRTYGLGSGILAFKFTTTNNPAYAGQVATTHTTTNATTRTVWISDCPGDYAAIAPRCVQEGREGVVIHWAQSPDTRSCALQTGRTYYINVKNARSDNLDVSTCTTNNCPFFMIIYTNGKP